MKFSVIVPIYNVGKYLPACIESLIKDAGDDREIILVDDGSPDNSPAICDEYAAKDARIRVIHQKNSGVSVARNAGMKIARGEWIMFIDGDDFVTPDAFSLMKEAASSQFDIIYFDFAYMHEGNPLVLSKKSVAPDVFEGEGIRELQRGVMYTNFDSPDAFDLCSTCGRLYRRAFLEANNCLFIPGLRRGQDVVFNLATISHAVRAERVKRELYVYRLHAESLVHRFSSNVGDGVKILLQWCEKVMREEYAGREDMGKRYLGRILSEFSSCLRLYIFSPENPMGPEQRKQALAALVREEPFARAVRECDASMLSSENAQMLKALRSGDFDGLGKLYSKDKEQSALKKVYMRLGLYKVKRAIKSIMGRE